MSDLDSVIRNHSFETLAHATTVQDDGTVYVDGYVLPNAPDRLYELQGTFACDVHNAFERQNPRAMETVQEYGSLERAV